MEINKFIIQKGLDKQLVLYWYQDRGRIITSEYWAKAYMVWDAIRRNRTDGAFVRITVPFTGEGEERAVIQGRAFAEQSFLSWLSIYQARCPCHKSCASVWLPGSAGLQPAPEAGKTPHSQELGMSFTQ